jgi:hypothetical protein
MNSLISKQDLPKQKLTTSVNLGSVGVNIVSLDHSLCSKNLSTLVVSERRLTADINHGLDTVGVANDTRRCVEGFGSLKRLDLLVNVAGSDGKNVNGVSSSKETRHIKIMDGHVGEDAAASLHVSEGWWRRITGAQLDLKSNES